MVALSRCQVAVCGCVFVSGISFDELNATRVIPPERTCTPRTRPCMYSMYVLSGWCVCVGGRYMGRPSSRPHKHTHQQQRLVNHERGAYRRHDNDRKHGKHITWTGLTSVCVDVVVSLPPLSLSFSSGLASAVLSAARRGFEE